MSRVSFYQRTDALDEYWKHHWPVAVWRAVLEQAIADIVDGPKAAEFRWATLEELARLKLDFRVAAQHWVDDPANEPRRFVWVCEQLDLEPDAVRRAINEKLQGAKS